MCSSWSQVKIVLDGFFDLLACGKCKKTPNRPMRYVKCGHFYCDVCIYGETRCFQCQMPVKVNDIQPYWMLAQLIDYCQLIKSVTIESKPDDLKRLSKAARRFVAEHYGIVPETDSESEDEIVESTPPGQRMRAKKVIELETSAHSDDKRLSQDLGKKTLQPDSAGYVDSTQFLASNKKRKFEVETVGFVESSQSSQNRRKENSLPETAGYVDPTQFSPCMRKKNLFEEKGVFADSTQSSPLQGAKNLGPETAGFVDPTQFSPIQRKRNIEPETMGHVDPTQFNGSRNECHSEPETSGFREHTQTPTSHKKKRFPLKTRVFTIRPLRIEQQEKNSLPESSASYVDPTQMRESRRKIDLQQENPGVVDSRPELTRTNVHSRQNKIDRVESIDPVPTDEHDRVQPGIVEYADPALKIASLNGKASITESAEFSDHHTFDKHGKGDLKIRSVERFDLTKKILGAGRNISSASPEMINSTPIDQSFREVDTQPKNCGIESSEGMDWVHSLRSNEDRFTATETLVADQSNFGNVLVPETPHDVENMTNYEECPMEIENDSTEKSCPIESSRLQTPGEKSSNIDQSAPTLPVVRESHTESMENRQETPYEKLKRIKNFSLNRRNNIRNLSRDRGAEDRQKSANNEPSIGNFSMDRCGKTSSSRDNSTFAINTETYCVETNESEEPTPPRRSRLTRNSMNKDENTTMNDSITTNTMDSVAKTFAVEKRRTRAESTKYVACEKDSNIDREILCDDAEGNTKLPEKKKKPLQVLKNIENLDMKSQIEDSANKCKQRIVKLKPRNSTDKSRPATPKAVPKNVNKRNAKGETALHTACVKGQEDYVKTLLEAGANPNTKDNANWTPLQEAVNLGHLEICKMLLQAGASANTPAMDNRTALHDASANDKLEEAALLLRFNANRNVYDKFGKSPLDYAVSDEMKSLLADDNKVGQIVDNDACAESTLDQSIIIPNAKVVVLPSNLSAENRKLLAQIAPKIKIEVATTLRPTVTHVVVDTNERNVTNLTYDVMLALLQGKWILNSQWITISKDLDDISEIDLSLFEVHGAPIPETPTRARTNEEKQNPRLFNNCFFYFAIGPRCTWSYEKFQFTKESLTNLVVAGQGEVLHREPDPEDVKDYKLTPFHVAGKPIHPLHRCSHYIIYMPGKDEPRVKYNMPHIKTLPVGWFLECIEKFALVDPLLMGIS